MSNCKYKLRDGVYYMVCDNGKEVPVDIDAPPKFKADDEDIIKQAIEEVNNV